MSYRVKNPHFSPFFPIFCHFSGIFGCFFGYFLAFLEHFRYYFGKFMELFEYFWEVLDEQNGKTQHQIVRISESSKEKSEKILLELYGKTGKLLEVRRIIP